MASAARGPRVRRMPAFHIRPALGALARRSTPTRVMLVQVIGFAGVSVMERILAVLSTEAQALRSRAGVRGRVIWVMDAD